MDPFFLKLLATCCVALFIGWRAINGPQPTFARVAASFEVVGMAVLMTANQKDDFNAHVGSIFMVIGLVVAIFMISVDCVYMVRTGLSKQKL